MKRPLFRTQSLLHYRSVQDGLWREYISLQPISFARFPSFNATAGLTGQTLVYDPESGQLEVVFDGEHHRGLCYRRKFGGNASLLYFNPNSLLIGCYGIMLTDPSPNSR